VLSPLTTDHVRLILQRANVVLCEDKDVHGIVSVEIIDYLANLADGDGMPSLPMANESEKRLEHV
jgi:hypothetical protein